MVEAAARRSSQRFYELMLVTSALGLYDIKHFFRGLIIVFADVPCTTVFCNSGRVIQKIIISHFGHARLGASIDSLLSFRTIVH